MMLGAVCATKLALVWFDMMGMYWLLEQKNTLPPPATLF